MSDFPNHSMNSLRSNSISYFVALIVCANQRLNIDSENPTYSKDLFVRNVFEETWSTSAVIAKRLLPTGRKNVFENFLSNTMLKHRGVAARQGARSHLRAGWWVRAGASGEEYSQSHFVSENLGGFFGESQRI